MVDLTHMQSEQKNTPALPSEPQHAPQPAPQGEPIATGGTLADRVTEVLAQKIKSGEFAVDARLPSELVLAQRFAVSRTVIREAVSRLKSEGMVETRQGSGTVVLGASVSAPFRIDVDMKDAMQAVLRVIELRRGLEAEMAALAAERRSEAQNAQIHLALLAIDEAVANGQDGVEQDLAFHTAISEASGNPLYTSLLQFLRQFLRAAISIGRTSAAQREEFSGQLKEEHGAIAAAIARQDTAGARAAAHRHLENVAERINATDAHFWNSEEGKVARKLARSEVPAQAMQFTAGMQLKAKSA
ncbi:MAG: GntR family transcriptional repressor for pyruvate dehydrogenase complex [Janthinobacterium sp.]|jgi:GntR family transcriptional repressor for pyruvate dehydrogenase complex